MNPLKENERKAIEFVGKNTTIPAPHIYGAYMFPEVDAMRRYRLIMSYMPGRSWLQVYNNLRPRSQARLTEELRGYMSQLSQFKQPKSDDGLICSFIGGEMMDGGLSNDRTRGPYTKEEHLKYLLQPVWPRDPEYKNYDRCKDILGNYNPSEDLQLCHADLHPGNIIIDKDAKGNMHITGIIDWTTARWHPPYWEFYKAAGGPIQPAGWPKMMQRVMKPYIEECDALVRIKGLAFR